MFLCMCECMCVCVSLYGCLCVAIENLYKVFSVWHVAASSRSGLLCQCRIRATVSCFSGEEEYFMTVPIWKGGNKDGYIGQIVSCSIEMCPSAFYIFITFCLELIEISSVSFFPAIRSSRYWMKLFENMFPWHGHTVRLNPTENSSKGSCHWFQILPEDPNWDRPWICVHFLETYPMGKRSGHSILFLYHASFFFLRHF